jgi:hypothetical protein
VAKAAAALRALSDAYADHVEHVTLAQHVALAAHVTQVAERLLALRSRLAPGSPALAALLAEPQRLLADDWEAWLARCEAPALPTTEAPA